MDAIEVKKSLDPRAAHALRRVQATTRFNVNLQLVTSASSASLAWAIR